MTKVPSPEELAMALDVLQRMAGAQQAPTAGVTVAQLWEAFCVAVGPERSKKIGQAGGMAHVLAFFGATPAHAVSLEDVDRYRAQRREDVTIRGGKTLPGTRNRELSTFRSLLNWGAERKRIPANPIRALKLEPENNVRHTVLDEPKMAKLLAACPVWLRTLLLVGFDTGLRREEIRLLRRDQVDWEAGSIRLYEENTKTHKARVVHLTYRSLKALRDLPDNGVHLFANEATGRPYGKTTIHAAFTAAVAKAGLHGAGGDARVWLHDATRRSFVTNAIRRGLTERQTMELSGHKSRKVFDRYLIQNEDDIARSVQRLEAAIAREVLESRKGPQRTEPQEQTGKPVDTKIVRRATRK